VTATRPAAPAVQPVGTLSRLKLTEPVALFAGGWSLLLILALLVVGAVTGEWPAVALAVAALLLTAPGVWAARSSAYSPRAVVQAVMRARQ
jgi:hypothetical protein